MGERGGWENEGRKYCLGLGQPMARKEVSISLNCRNYPFMDCCG